MNTKYSHAQREQYGRLLAALLCDQHFGARPTATLDGPAVLRFTPIRQVNLFVVQALLGKWTAEMAQLRSAYFDFEDADVRQALTQFMNVLSRRIKLSRPTYEPLLAQAITDTLAGALDPTATLTGKLLGEATVRTPAQLREGLRYLDTNKALFESFVDALPADQEQTRDYLLSRFRQHQEAATVEPVAALVGQFDELLALSEDDLRESGPAAAAAAPALAQAPTPPPAPQPAPAPPAEAPQPVAQPTPTAPAEAPHPAPVTVAKQAPEPAAATAPAASVPLYAKLKAEHAGTPSLSETLRPDRAATLGDKAPQVESLREAISINQRFSFINELFAGENMQYHAAIQHLDALPDADTAKRYVTENLAAEQQWVRKDEHVSKLLKLIDRKFSA
ncbi:hypothetical protein CDA63_15915 [Hymenobacter amundsenii]|uniref:Uncharacterized protein n=1 Tax=Hymenobacter amundsenii TaxID=2006685 RepID=A0A246FKL7_9BACT|nr:hypothetical protein [Hymenobacter amundsenii]OWP62135.1 hypothetical protein CDA63_15915 [Hymenobacter amundsenii]